MSNGDAEAFVEESSVLDDGIIENALRDNLRFAEYLVVDIPKYYEYMADIVSR